MHVLRRYAAAVFAVAGYPEEPQAPSEGQCKLDRGLWSADIGSPTAIQSVATGPLKARETLRRAIEMNTCSFAYGKPEKDDLYAIISRGYNMAYDIRVSDFFSRHPDYLQTFIDEDAAGRR